MKCYINGRWSQGRGTLFQSFDPSTHNVVWEGVSASIDDVDLAVDAACAAWRDWSSLAMVQRKSVIEAFCKMIELKSDELARMISLETGKPIWEALTEVTAMIRKGAISIRSYDERCPVKQHVLAEMICATRYKSHGVMAVLGPYNLPGHLPNGHIIPALLAGNTVVFKPSEQVPLVGEFIVSCWEKSGLPEGVINLIQGAGETGVALVNHPRLNGILFTGSVNVGKAIHKANGGCPERILALEMGGNNPLIVWEVDNLQAAVYMTIQSAFITSGQRCTCARRLIVTEGSEGDEFLAQLVEACKKIIVGLPEDQPEPFMGPLISKDAAQKVLDAQKFLIDHGGKVIMAISQAFDCPALLGPGIIDVTHMLEREDVEIFGPLLQVIRVKDFDHAIIEANQTCFGLAAGLLSDRRENYDQLLAQSRAGIVNWNRPTTGASSESPFGGIGQSGNHRPSAYHAADYCAYPVASIESEYLVMPQQTLPGVDL